MNPLKYILEKVIKNFLSEYLESEYLNLEDLSFFDTSILLKNLILKNKTINQQLSFCELLKGEIKDLTIEYSILENQIYLYANDIDCFLLISKKHIDAYYLYSEKNKKKTNKNDFDESNLILSSSKTKEEGVVKLFNSLKNIEKININIKNITCDVYIDFSIILFQIRIKIDEFSSKSVESKTNQDSQKNNENYHDLNTNLNIDSMSLSQSRYLSISDIKIWIENFNKKELIYFKNLKEITLFNMDKQRRIEQEIINSSFYVDFTVYNKRFNKLNISMINNLNKNNNGHANGNENNHPNSNRAKNKNYSNQNNIESLNDSYSNNSNINSVMNNRNINSSLPLNQSSSNKLINNKTIEILKSSKQRNKIININNYNNISNNDNTTEILHNLAKNIDLNNDKSNCNLEANFISNINISNFSMILTKLNLLALYKLSTLFKLTITMKSEQRKNYRKILDDCLVKIKKLKSNSSNNNNIEGNGGNSKKERYLYQNKEKSISSLSSNDVFLMISIYLFLRLIQKQVVNYKFSFYQLNVLIFKYKETLLELQLLGVTEFLFKNHVEDYFKSFSLNNISSRMLSIDDVEKLQNKTFNLRLKMFIINIISEISLIASKSNFHVVNQDYFKFKLNIRSLVISFENNMNFNSKENKDKLNLLSNVMYFRERNSEQCYLNTNSNRNTNNNCESEIGFNLFNNNNSNNSDFKSFTNKSYIGMTNTLFKVYFDSLSIQTYSNLNDLHMINLELKSLSLIDHSYRLFSKNTFFPILNISNYLTAKINLTGQYKEFKLDIPFIFFCMDPYFYYFTILIYKEIYHKAQSFMYSYFGDETLFFLEEPNLQQQNCNNNTFNVNNLLQNQYINDNNNKNSFSENFKIKINIDQAAFSLNFSKYIANNKAFFLGINFIEISSDFSKPHLPVSLEEIGIGVIENNNLEFFLKHKTFYKLDFTILNLFNLSYDFGSETSDKYESNSTMLNLTIPDIFIKLRLKDIKLLHFYATHIKTIDSLIPNFILKKKHYKENLNTKLLTKDLIYAAQNTMNSEDINTNVRITKEKDRFSKRERCIVRGLTSFIKMKCNKLVIELFFQTKVYKSLILTVENMIFYNAKYKHSLNNCIFVVQKLAVFYEKKISRNKQADFPYKNKNNMNNKQRTSKESTNYNTNNIYGNNNDKYSNISNKDYTLHQTQRSKSKKKNITNIYKNKDNKASDQKEEIEIFKLIEITSKHWKRYDYNFEDFLGKISSVRNQDSFGKFSILLISEKKGNNIWLNIPNTLVKIVPEFLKFTLSIKNLISKTINFTNTELKNNLSSIKSLEFEFSKNKNNKNKTDWISEKEKNKPFTIEVSTKRVRVLMKHKETFIMRISVYKSNLQYASRGNSICGFFYIISLKDLRDVPNVENLIVSVVEEYNSNTNNNYNNLNELRSKINNCFTIDLQYKISSNEFNMSVDKMKVFFLNRTLMDCIQYYYFILYTEIVEEHKSIFQHHTIEELFAKENKANNYINNDDDSINNLNSKEQEESVIVSSQNDYNDKLAIEKKENIDFDNKKNINNVNNINDYFKNRVSNIQKINNRTSSNIVNNNLNYKMVNNLRRSSTTFPSKNKNNFNSLKIKSRLSSIRPKSSKNIFYLNHLDNNNNIEELDDNYLNSPNQGFIKNRYSSKKMINIKNLNSNSSRNVLAQQVLDGVIKEETEEIIINIILTKGEIHFGLNSLKKNDYSFILSYDNITFSNPMKQFTNYQGDSFDSNGSYSNNSTDPIFNQFYDRIVDIDKKHRVNIKNVEYMINVYGVKIFKLIKNRFSGKLDKLVFAEISNLKKFTNKNKFQGKRYNTNINKDSNEFPDLIRNNNINMNNNFNNISNNNETASYPSITVYLDITKKTQFFNLSKIFIAVPYIKLKLYEDVLENIFRLIFENFAEEYDIYCKESKDAKDFFSIHKNIDFKFLEIALAVDTVNIQLHNYNSMKANSHKNPSNSIIAHKIISSNYNKQAEYDKFCNIILTNVYYDLRKYFNNNNEMVVYIEDVNVYLNKSLKYLYKVSNTEFIKKKSNSVLNINSNNDDKENNNNKAEKIENNDNEENNNINLNSKNENNSDVNHHDNSNYFSTKRQKFKPKTNKYSFIYSSKYLSKEEIEQEMIFNNLQIEYNQFVITVLQTFFTKYLYYYKNTKIRYVDHLNNFFRTVRIKMIDVLVTLTSSKTPYSNYFEIVADIAADILLKIEGNTTIGPFKDNRTINLLIKSIYFNEHLNFFRKQYENMKHQLTGMTSFLFEINGESLNRLKIEESRNYFYTIKQTNVKDLFEYFKKTDNKDEESSNEGDSNSYSYSNNSLNIIDNKDNDLFEDLNNFYNNANNANMNDNNIEEDIYPSTSSNRPLNNNDNKIIQVNNNEGNNDKNNTDNLNHIQNKFDLDNLKRYSLLSNKFINKDNNNLNLFNQVNSMQNQRKLILKSIPNYYTNNISNVNNEYQELLIGKKYNSFKMQPFGVIRKIIKRDLFSICIEPLCKYHSKNLVDAVLRNPEFVEKIDDVDKLKIIDILQFMNRETQDEYIKYFNMDIIMEKNKLVNHNHPLIITNYHSKDNKCDVRDCNICDKTKKAVMNLVNNRNNSNSKIKSGIFINNMTREEKHQNEFINENDNKEGILDKTRNIIHEKIINKIKEKLHLNSTDKKNNDEANIQHNAVKINSIYQTKEKDHYNEALQVKSKHENENEKENDNNMNNLLKQNSKSHKEEKIGVIERFFEEKNTQNIEKIKSINKEELKKIQKNKEDQNNNNIIKLKEDLKYNNYKKHNAKINHNLDLRHNNKSNAIHNPNNKLNVSQESKYSHSDSQNKCKLIPLDLTLDMKNSVIRKAINKHSYSEEDFLYGKNSKIRDKERFEISLNSNHIKKIKHLIEEVNSFNKESFKELKSVKKDKEVFEKIKYNYSYLYQLENISIIILESQFNSKLFEVFLFELNMFKSSLINHSFTSSLIKDFDFDLNTLYSGSYAYDAKTNKPNTKQFTADIILKFIFKINYHDNSKITWEPFIEPCPISFYQLESNIENFMALEIQCLKPVNIGVSSLVRQKCFHSLNININEIIIENMNNFYSDFSRHIYDNKHSGHDNSGFSEENNNLEKKLIIHNLTNFYLFIVNSRDFKHENRVKEENKIILDYKSTKDIRLKEEVVFLLCSPEIGKKIELNNNYKRQGTVSNYTAINNLNHTIISSKSHNNNINSNINLFPNANTELLNNNNNNFSNNNFNKSITNINFNMSNPLLNSFMYNNPRRQLGYLGNDSESGMRLSIEKTQRLYTIITMDETVHKRKSNIDVEEIRKRFNEKFQILLKNEFFLVCDMELGIEENQKKLTLRSNYSLKNSLDFPIQLSLISNEGTNLMEKMILLPGNTFNFPISILNKISDMKIKPFFFDQNNIDFNSSVVSISQQLDNNENQVFIITCPVRYIYPKYSLHQDNNNSKEFNFSPSVDFIMKKEIIKVENEFLDENIKKRIELVKEYLKFKGLKFEENNKNKLDQLIGDVTFVLLPFYKICNSLPRMISIKKKLIKDTKINILKESNVTYSLDVYFDIDLFIKNFSSSKLMTSLISEQNDKIFSSDSINKDKLIRHAAIKQEYQDILISDSDVNLMPIGDCISLYEPFAFTKTYQRKSQLQIIIHDYVISHQEIYSNSKQKKTKAYKKEITISTESWMNFYINPFDVKILRNSDIIYDQNKSKNYFIKYPEYSKSNFETIALKTEDDNPKKLNLFYYFEKREDSVQLTSYIYCPFLFVNSSGFDLDLEDKFNNSKTSLKNYDHDVQYNKNSNYFYGNLLHKVIMFNPTTEKNFKFCIQKKQEAKDIKHSKSFDFFGTKKTSNSEELDSSKLNAKETTDKNEKENSNNNVLYTKLLIEDIISKPKQIELESDKETFFTIPNFETAKRSIFNLMSYDANKEKVKKMNNSLVAETKKRTNRYKLAIQTKSLTDCLRFSKLIFITPQLIVKNCTKRDIYLYHINKEDGFMHVGDCIREGKIKKINFVEDCYDFFRMSFEDKPNSDNNLYSGIIRFNKSSGFYVKIYDRDKELVLIFCKVYEIYGFLLVVFHEKPQISDYPYFVVNYLDVEIKYKQSEFKENEFKTFSESLFYYSHITERIIQPNKNPKLEKITEDKINSNLAGNYNYIVNYSWDEPFIKNKNDRCILELCFFGSKFEVDLEDIHEDIKFLNSTKRLDEDMVVIRDKLVSRGTLTLANKVFSSTTTEFTYYLYEFGLILQNQENKQIRFNFYDESAECERSGSGKIILKNKNQEYEVYCVGSNETNTLGINICNFIEKAQKFSKEVIIKKYVKNKSIFLAISKKNLFQISKIYSMNFKLCKLNNIGLSLIQKGKEFMYLWIKDLVFASYKTNEIYKSISLKIRDYQIDHFLENAYYPTILSPLTDYEEELFKGKKDPYYNIIFELESLLILDNFTKVDKVYVNINPSDIRLEFNFVEKLMNFIYNLTVIMNVYDNTKNKENLLKILENIFKYNFLEDKIANMQNDQFLLIKQLFIEEMKCCISIKFDNIDIFFDKTNLVFLKPIIEDLGLKILNIDSNIYNLAPFARLNLFNSKEEFFSKLSSYYYNQLISELVKSFGGFSSFTSFHFVENINRNILNSMRNRNIIITRRQKHQIKDFAESTFMTLSIVVSGLFLRFFKFFSLMGKYLSKLTLDSAYQQKRQYKINKRIKSLCHGITISIKIFFFSLFYIISQFYYVPLKMFSIYNYCGILFAFFIIILGIIFKPVLAFIDLLAINFETISISINDVLGDRVKRMARFQRYIPNDCLKEYSSLDALSYAIYNQTNKKTSNENVYDHKFLVVVGKLNKKKRVLLFFTLDSLVIVQYIDYQFKTRYKIHFSECKLFRGITRLEDFYSKKSSKKIGFMKNEKGAQYVLVTYEKKNESCFNKSKYNLLIELHKIQPIVDISFNSLVDMIFDNKKQNIIN